MAASGLAGVKMTTSQVKGITSDLTTISSDIDEILKNFQGIMAKLTGQSEGGLIDQTATAAEQLYDGGTRLARCCLDLGTKIGDYLNVMISGDSETARQLVEQIRR